jgi:hypothetical protein
MPCVIVIPHRMALRSLAAINAAPFRTPSLVISIEPGRCANPPTHQRHERCASLRPPEFVLALFSSNLIDLLFVHLNLVFDVGANRSKRLGELQNSLSASPSSFGSPPWLFSYKKPRSHCAGTGF